jgi:hypothetical protein
VAGFDSEMKVYDFRLDKDDDGTVRKLDFHLLIPHRYKVSEEATKEKLLEKMRVYKADIDLDIRFVKSFI